VPLLVKVYKLLINELHGLIEDKKAELEEYDEEYDEEEDLDDEDEEGAETEENKVRTDFISNKDL
jgi:hypothetical protein